MNIETAEGADISNMVKLSAIKRKAYANAQPVFWRKHPNADSNQEKWFAKLLNDEQYIALVATQDKQLVGFIIGHIIDAPDVYEPGGKTLYVDDFCVSDQWTNTGQLLLEAIVEVGTVKDCCQLLVVCGSHDEAKKSFLENTGYRCINHWFHKEI